MEIAAVVVGLIMFCTIIARREVQAVMVQIAEDAGQQKLDL